MTSKSSSSTAAAICALPGCDNPLIQTPDDGRPRLYCRTEHRLEARRLRRESRRPALAAGSQQPRPAVLPAVLPAVPLRRLRPVRRTVRVPVWAGRRTRLATALLLLVTVLATPAVVSWWQTRSAGPGTALAAQPPAAATASAAGGAMTGLHAALWNGYRKADQALVHIRQEAAATSKAARALEAIAPSSRTAAMEDALTQLRRRETALERNSIALQRQVDAWTSYVQLQAQYTAGTQELAAVDQAVRALEGLPNPAAVAGYSKTLASLIARRAELQRSVRTTGITLDRLLFVDLGPMADPPPMPRLPELSGSGQPEQAIPA